MYVYSKWTGDCMPEFKRASKPKVKVEPVVEEDMGMDEDALKRLGVNSY